MKRTRRTALPWRLLLLLSEPFILINSKLDIDSICSLFICLFARFYTPSCGSTALFCLDILKHFGLVIIVSLPMSPDAFVFLSFLFIIYARGRKGRPAQILHSYTLPFCDSCGSKHHSFYPIFLFSFSYSPIVCMHLWSGFDLTAFSLWWYLRNCLVYACFSPRSYYIDVALQGWFLEQAQCPFRPSPTIQPFIACFLLYLVSCYIYIYVPCTCIHVCVYF